MDDAGACRWKWLASLVLAMRMVAGPAAGADLIYFRGGSDAQLPATTEGNRVVLILPDGKLELHREDIVKRVPGFWPADEWDSRRREARGAGFASRYAAAWWAIENGLTEEAAVEIRELHALDPKHAPTARMAAVLDRLARPCPDPDVTAFRQALGIETKLAQDRISCCSINRATPKPRSEWRSWSRSSRGSTCSSPLRGWSCRCRGTDWSRPGSRTARIT